MAAREELLQALGQAGLEVRFSKRFMQLVRALDQGNGASIDRLVTLATAIAEHEAHRYPSVDELFGVVCIALHRVSRGRKSGAFHLPTTYVNALQDAGLPIERALDALEWVHEGFQRWKTETRCASTTEERELDMYWQAVQELIDALTGPRGAALITKPRCLRTAIRCAWHRRMRRPEDFRDTFGIVVAYDEFGFNGAELLELFDGTQYGGMVGFGIGLATGAIAKPEVLAIVRSGTGIRDLPPEEQVRLINAAIAMREQVRPERFLRTAMAIGIETATALHAHTDDASLAIRANAVRERRGLSLHELIDAYAELHTLPMSFEQFVELIERWDLPALRTATTAYPDAALLCRLMRTGSVPMIARAAAAGVPQSALVQYGDVLLRYLKPRADAGLCDATRAYEFARGDVAVSDAFLALPKNLREHPAVARAADQLGVDGLQDQALIELVVAIADAGHAVNLELVEWFRRSSAWPNRQSMARVYGLALQFCAAGRGPADALHEALEVYDRLSPRKCARAALDRGYFQYVVLGEMPTPTPAPVEASETPDAVAATMSGVKRVRRASGPAAHPDDPAPARGALPIDLRTLHEQLDLRDLVPQRVDTETVSALIVYGLCDLGKACPYAGSNGLPERHILRNTSRKYSVEPSELQRAWQWLQAIGIAVHPPGRGNRTVFVLDLSDGHQRPEAQEIARRTKGFLSWFQQQIRH